MTELIPDLHTFLSALGLCVGFYFWGRHNGHKEGYNKGRSDYS